VVRMVRPIVTVLMAVGLALASVGPVVAADPQPLVDGTVTVTFAEADGTPVDDATVTLTASPPSDLPEVEPLYTGTETTDANGTATFSGVPYPAEGGPALVVTASAQRVETVTDENGCTLTTTHQGTTTDVEAAPTVAIDVIAIESGIGACEAPLIEGTVLGPDGEPFAVKTARVTQFGPNGVGAEATKFTVAGDGSFAITLRPWGTPDAPSRVEFDIVGVTSRIDIGDGCVAQSAIVARDSFDLVLASGEAPDRLMLEGSEQQVGQVCGGASATPTTNQPTARPTLPPTDAAPGFLDGPASAVASVAAVIGGLLLVAAGLALAAGRRSEGRRGR
jgi:hypothetical protein